MNETVNLTVYQFGPISEADVVFDKYTVLIGKQGSGKVPLPNYTPCLRGWRRGWHAVSPVKIHYPIFTIPENILCLSPFGIIL